MYSCWSLSALVASAVEAHRRAPALSGLRLGRQIRFEDTSQARRSYVSLQCPLVFSVMRCYNPQEGTSVLHLLARSCKISQKT